MNRALLFFFLGLTCLFLVGGTFYLKYQTRLGREAMERELTTIADLKVGQIANWYRERINDANDLFNNPMTMPQIASFLTNPSRSELRPALQQWLQLLTDSYSSVVIYDAKGTAQLWAPANFSPPATADTMHQREIQNALAANRIIFTDIQIHQEEKSPPRFLLHFWIPIKATPHAPTVGVVLLNTDPNEFLFPRIQTWPTLSKTGESLLVRREENEVVFLNSLRHRQTPPLSLHFPITTTPLLPATEAVTGHVGIFEGIDYRQKPVLSALRKIPDTPWFLVAKMDLEEIDAPMRLHTWTTSIIVMLLVITSALLTALIETHQRAKIKQALHIRNRAIETSSTAFVIFDLDGKLSYVNPIALSIWGYQTLDNVMNKSIRDFWNLSQDSDDILRLLQEKKVWTSELETRRQDGTMLHILITANLVQNERGMPLCYIASFVDITETKRTEAELRRAKEIAEAANKAKSEFLAIMSHEIRTPLVAIIGMAELLERSNLDPLQKHRLEVIIASGENLIAIINDILDFSKIESSMLTLKNIIFDLRTEISILVISFRSIAGERKLELSTSIAHNIPKPLSGDPIRLRQILGNLISNAIKFTSAGSVTLRVSVISTSPGEALLRFEVEDTGAGIPQDKMASLFKPFSQLDTSTTRKYGGTGLGLVISMRLVKLMGGEIGCDSQPGKGSTFWFTAKFNVPSQSEHVKSADAVASPVHTALHVLLAEDNMVSREVTASQITDLGCLVNTAEDGSQALKAALKNHYDIIFLDVHMPIIDGIEVAHKIRAHEQDSQRLNVTRPRTSIIGLTADSQDSTRQRCIESGMDDILVKPYRMKELLDFIRRWTPSPAAASTTSPTPVQDAPHSTPTQTKALPDIEETFQTLLQTLGHTKLDAITRDFLKRCDTTLTLFREALEKDDLPLIAKTAHNIRGAFGHYGAHSAVACSAQIEKAAREGQKHAVAEKLPSFEQEIMDFNHRITRLLK